MPFAAANPSHLPTPSHPLAEFHGHLILLMWHDIYEERQERVSWDVRGVSSP